MVLTSLEENYMEPLAKRHGALACLSKPLSAIRLQEAIETVIYLYEVQGRRKMPETGELLRYALKLATGTGKTLVMALVVTWATLHKRKVSGSSLGSGEESVIKGSSAIAVRT